MKLRIVVADDNPKFLSALVTLLETTFEVVATAEDGGSALEYARRLQPDVVILDLTMPTLNGIDVTRELRNQSRAPGVVICSVETDPEIIEAARQGGALGYVSKTRLANDLIAAVNSVARGEPFVSVQ
jgi:DNA-binding NarL/FixJ family response regulator